MRNSRDQFKVGSANQMATMLAEWDSKAALPVLKARVDRCSRVVQAGQEAGGRFHGMEAGIAEPDRAPHRGGRPAGARRLRRLGPHRHARPLRLPADRDVRAHVAATPTTRPSIAAAAALFDDPKSPWNPSVWPGDVDVAERASGAICSPARCSA